MNPARKYIFLAFLVLAGFLFMPLKVQAAPAKVAHQGRLLDASSQPISTAVTVNFDIFDAPTGGLSVWNESQSITPDALGFYETFLGNVNPLPSVLPEPGYLQLTINSEILNPRLEIGSVPFSLQAGDISCNGCVVSADISSGTIVDANISSTAAIAGTKINPDFGDQNILTTGQIGAGGSETGTAATDIKAYIQKVACENRRGVWVDGTGCQEYAYFTAPCTFTSCVCDPGYHMCSIGDLLSGGFSSLRRSGYNNTATYIWIAGAHSANKDYFFYPWSSNGNSLQCSAGTHYMMDMRRNASGNTAWGCYSDLYGDASAACCKDNQ